MQQKIDFAVIGGSGLYEIESLEVLEELNIDTPFGNPSDAIIVGKMHGKTIAFLARHARGHKLTPSEINYQANIAALKILGVKRILSISAVGSLKQEIEPGHFVLVDQFIDRTQNRKASFFGQGLVAHVALAHPTCKNLREEVQVSAHELGLKFHPQGTYVCMEGPLFSTQAESHLYRSWGADVIGMTNLTEAKLAREAEICYSTVALSTDYDCWHPEHDSVSAEMIIQTLNQNVNNAKDLIKTFSKNLSEIQDCSCHHALKSALVTQKENVPERTLNKLNFLLPSSY